MNQQSIINYRSSNMGIPMDDFSLADLPDIQPNKLSERTVAPKKKPPVDIELLLQRRLQKQLED